MLINKFIWRSNTSAGTDYADELAAGQSGGHDQSVPAGGIGARIKLLIYIIGP
jgi:hypothetical protein